MRVGKRSGIRGNPMENLPPWWTMNTWKIGDLGAEQVIKTNVAFYDKIRSVLNKRCLAPNCGYVLSSIELSFAVPGVGAVCNLCYYMYEALQHGPFDGVPGLKNIFYFRQLHDQWKRDNDPGNDWKRKDRLGL